MLRFLIPFLFASLVLARTQAQAPVKMNPDEIHHAIEKLNFLGTVLYVAAHPDDENTRMISYFANEVHARTAYLSITRGDGGQNLIGPEIRELLGVIRTNELLEARKLDGGEQFFTRANDFGYSKHPDETLNLWNKEEVIGDVVKVIRKFQPDVIINRFNAESAGMTHGHHTSSAMLSLEAFDLAAKEDYPTDGYAPWKVNSIYFNTHWWFYGSREEFEQVDKSKMVWVDTGTYYPDFGLSNSEISSLSRSMHKSQGFGSTGTRGSEREYLQLLKGYMPKDPNNVFEGIDTSWSRLKGGEEIGEILTGVQQDFDFRDPSRSIPGLVKAYALIIKLEDSHWREYKTRQIKEIIAACAGLYLEAVTDMPYAAEGENTGVKLEAINRSSIPMNLSAVRFDPDGTEMKLDSALQFNRIVLLENELSISNGLHSTSPYWLEKKGDIGMYAVEKKDWIGLPLNPRELQATFQVEIEGVTIPFDRELVYKFNDPVKGEVYQPFEIVPPVSGAIPSKVVLFDEKSPREIPLVIKAHMDGVKGQASLQAPDGWEVSPAVVDFSMKSKGEELTVKFVVRPEGKQGQGFLNPVFEVEGKQYDKALSLIDYEHIPRQMIYLPSETKVARLDLQKEKASIAYIEGAGDEIPKYLRQIGYEVDIIDPKNISSTALKSYAAVITGIRAYNTVPELKFKQSALLDYVKNGGNLIVQYNTSHRLVLSEDLAPYPMELSRKRITDENAEVTFLAPGHELMNFPNKISKDDFDGWVQERGLYFPETWSKEFVPLFSFRENGEEPMKGSLLVAKYGKGNYIYTGLSFFREIPAGVPGAYKLMVNMISLGQNETSAEIKE